MRRFDKINNIRKANLLSEQRYLQSKGLLNENVDLINESQIDNVIDQAIEDKPEKTSALENKNIRNWFKKEIKDLKEVGPKAEGGRFIVRFLFHKKNKIAETTLKNIVNTLTAEINSKGWEETKQEYLESPSVMLAKFPKLKNAVDKGFELLQNEDQEDYNTLPDWLKYFPKIKDTFAYINANYTTKLMKNEQYIYESIYHLLIGEWLAENIKTMKTPIGETYVGFPLDFLINYQELISIE